MAPEPLSPLAPPRRGLPAWAWVFIGCGACFVIAIVVIISILPLFAQARERARLQTCMVNVQHLSRAMQLYAQDNNEHFPPGNEWMDCITKHQPNDRFYHCPAVAGVKTARFGYAFNSDLSERSLGKIGDPHQVPLIYDSSNLSRNATDPVTSLPNPPRHDLRKGNVIGYVDMHVKVLRASEMQAFK